MSEKKASIPALPTLIMAAALFGGILLVDQPLRSKRGAMKDLASTFRLPEDVAAAKLWEDPFEAVHRQLSGDGENLARRSAEFRLHYCNILQQLRKNQDVWRQSYIPADRLLAAQEVCPPPKGKGEKPRSPSSKDLEEQLISYDRERDALEEIQGLHRFRRKLWRVPPSPPGRPGTLFLGVAVQGGPHHEMAEARRRARIAFASALNRRGYFPEREGDISYLLFPEDRRRNRLVTHLAGGIQLNSELVPVPYEIFELQSGVPCDLPANYAQVIVLWLDQERFGGRIKGELARIAETMTNLPRIDKSRALDASREEELETAYDFVLVGPRTSSDLVEMLRAATAAEGRIASVASALETVAHYHVDRKSTVFYLPGPAAAELDAMFQGNRGLAGEKGSELGRTCARLLKDEEFRQGFEKAAGQVLADFVSPAAGSDPASRHAILEEWKEELLWTCVEIRFRERVERSALPEKALISLPANRYRRILQQIRTLSAYATAPDAVADSFAGKQQKYTWGSRTIADDAEVLFALVRELEQRGIHLFGEKRAHVAVISELDSSYGQALPLTFRSVALMGRQARFQQVDFNQAFRDLERSWRHPQECRPEQLAEIRKLDELIHVYGYFRGLDGITAAAAPPPGVEKDGGPTADKKLQGSPERAEGASLLDQIRSLGLKLKDLDETLRVDDQRIHAIGVLGTDFYDKQLALQVLRPIFPDVVFFTTDLDARYLHRDDQKWNRNLLVGSSYGFELERDEQGGTPPFRDVYSTSAYKSGILALGECAFYTSLLCRDLATAVQQTEWGDAVRLEPKVYEIGITRAHALPPAQGQPRWKLKGLLLILAVAAIAVVVSRRVRSEAATIVLTILYLVGSVLLVDRIFADEPAALLEGVSVRGTEILRLLMIYFAVTIFILLRRKLRDAQEEIAPRFVGPLETKDPLPFLEWMYISAAFDKERKKDTEDAEVKASEAWELYLDLQGGGRRFLGLDRQLVRVLVMTFAAFGVVAICAAVRPDLFEFPLVPVRGHLLADKILRYLSLFCLAFASFWSLDTVRLCVLFVDRLASGRTDWPANEKNLKSAERRGLPLGMIGDYLDIRVIAPLTEVVAWTVLYPFFLLAIYILSRANFFDSWTWPWIVAFIIVVLLVCILIAAILLQSAARRARESALKFLRLARTEGASKDPGTETKTHNERLDILIKEVESIDRGAFGPWTSNPVVGALLLPFGGASAVSLIDFLLRIGM